MTEHLPPLSPPLTTATNVLKPETLLTLRRVPLYSLRGYRILDRWAQKSPDALRHLDESGELVLFIRLLKQQRLEQRAVDQQPELSEQEALDLANVQTELE
ncbi:hypothetical protein ACFWP0_12320 [Achromobacter sp. NPDC058515]|uniref:hypothetical protein n=1 Tax=Achromobacter sp. NPDC058515 TaxID=3346533 RepID=UPI003662F60B